jgi:hypothetical protein
MKFNWLERRHIFNPNEISNWDKTHAQVPYYFENKGEKRIFFTSRPPQLPDGSYVSNVHSVSVDIINSEVLVSEVNSKPLLELGELGTFDETGTMPCSIIYNPKFDEVWMYYVGWNRKQSVPYDCAVGLAISKDNGKTFTKYSNGPIMAQNLNDPFLVGCPRVYRFDGTWYMFYLAGIKWVDYDGKKESYYKLKRATSEDGINWNREDRFLIPELYEMESQTCASVIYYGNSYHMFFTFRHTVDFRNPQRGYRIGYASSNDLINWNRDDEAGNFFVSEKGWDSEMVCYPNLNLLDGKLVMLYCGNNFGLNGFGYAINNI